MKIELTEPQRRALVRMAENELELAEMDGHLAERRSEARMLVRVLRKLDSAWMPPLDR